MDIEIQSLYFTLSSGHICGADNETKSNFTTILYKPFNLPKDLFEIGLTQVFYKAPLKIFEGPDSSHFMQVFSSKEVIAEIYIKIYDTIGKTISRFNTNSPTGFTIFIEFDDEMNFNISIQAPYKEDRVVRFTELTRRLFGFVNIQYETLQTGLIKAENFVDIDLFKSLKINSSVEIQLVNTAEITNTVSMLVYESLPKSIARFNFNMHGSSFAILMIFAEGDFKVKIIPKFRKNTVLRLPDLTRRLFGFTKLEYKLEKAPENEIFGENNCDLEVYKSLPEGYLVTMDLVTNPRLNKRITVGQPFGIHLEDLVTQLNLSLQSEDIEATFVPGDSHIIYNSEDSNLKIRFSDSLNRILGLQEGAVISGKEAEILSVDLFRGNRLFVVECDLIESQVWGAQCKQALKIFNQSKGESVLVNNTFHPVQYCAIKNTQFNSIRIRVANESGEDISFEEEGFTCVLHLRLKPNV